VSKSRAARGAALRCPFLSPVPFLGQRSDAGCVVGSLSGWVGSGFFARSSLMLVGAAERVRSDVMAWFAFHKAPLRKRLAV
jgi:hypothetical protein